MKSTSKSILIPSKNDFQKKPGLYICPTPIGNLSDVTLRVLETLETADVIAAEDTRHTRKLLSHYEIHTPLVSYHEHNWKSSMEMLIKRLQNGQIVALVSDAGTPGISDPGERLVKAAIEKGIQVISLPGPTAFVTALVASGLEASQFIFIGFLDRQKKRREQTLEEVKYHSQTLIFYEAPHRVLQTLKDILKILGNRKTVTARELTKTYESYVRGSVSHVIEVFEEKAPRGEFVIIVEGIDGKKEEKDPLLDLSLEAHIEYFLNQGLRKKEVAARVAKARGLSKRDIYKMTTEF